MTVQSIRTTIVALATVALALGGTLVAEGQVRDDTSQGRRPTTPTVLGDTGLWFVPTAEVLPHGHWSVSTFRVNSDRQQGFTDISHFAGSGSVGIKNRLELFGALNTQTRIDRDVRPLSDADMPATGGLDNDYPFVNDGFSRGVGDLSLGAKINVFSETRGHPVAFAVRSLVKLPTGEVKKGVSTGEPDLTVDATASKDFGAVEVAGFGGAIVRGDTPNVDLPNGVRWGVGAGLPMPARFRIVSEIRGEAFLEDEVVAARPIVARDGSLSPLRSLVRNPVDALVGLTWQAPNGVFVGAGVSWAARFSARDRFGVSSGTASSAVGDRLGFQMGIGYRPGRRPAPPRLADAPPPRASAPAPAPPVDPSPEPARVAAGDPVELVFEDIHFDFDRYTLRSTALRVLDEAVAALNATPTLAVTIDGHTCNIGTAEYNIALADRRASAVKEYLVSRGVAASRLTTIAYGEERPGYNNAREETRRMNRRAALVVELTSASDGQ